MHPHSKYQNFATWQMPGFLKRLSCDERHVLKGVLSSKIHEFFDNENRLLIENEASLERFNLLAEMLRQITSYSDPVPPNGIAYRGHPAWVTQELLASLQAEACQRRGQPLDRIDHYLGCGGEIADTLTVSPEVIAFVTEHIGPVVPTGIASYLYYDRPGLGIRPHVDTDVFSINLMLMLRHECVPNVTTSATVIFPAWGEPEYYRLIAGEVMIMYGGGVIHTRSIVQENENIHLLTIGFNRLFTFDDQQS